MLTFLKQNFLYIIIAILAVIIGLQRCTHNTPSPIIPSTKNVVITKVDTTFVVKHITIKDTLHVYPRLTKTKPSVAWMHDTLYKPDPNYSVLLKQYTILGSNHFDTNTYMTPINFGKYGSANILDTISENRLIGSSINYKLNIPDSTNIITVHQTEKPNRQFYVGGGLSGNSVQMLNGANVGVLYKTRQDHIYEFKVGYSTGNGISYTVGTYWKIKIF